jgi:hypothetical protein
VAAPRTVLACGRGVNERERATRRICYWSNL